VAPPRGNRTSAINPYHLTTDAAQLRSACQKLCSLLVAPIVASRNKALGLTGSIALGTGCSAVPGAGSGHWVPKSERQRPPWSSQRLCTTRWTEWSSRRTQEASPSEVDQAVQSQDHGHRSLGQM